MIDACGPGIAADGHGASGRTGPGGGRAYSTGVFAKHAPCHGRLDIWHVILAGKADISENDTRTGATGTARAVARREQPVA